MQVSFGNLRRWHAPSQLKHLANDDELEHTANRLANARIWLHAKDA